MPRINVKSFGRPDERRPFTDKGHLDVIRFGDAIVGRGVFEPGWRWSNHVKPIAETESCQADHASYVVSGRMHLVTDDGEEADIGPGDFFTIGPGHDAWVVGDEPCIIFDFAGYEAYAKPRAAETAREAPPAPPA
jgi:hypothetical protein